MKRDAYLTRIGFILLLILLAFGSIYFLFKKSPFLKESVAIEIFAPSQVSAGEHVEYTVVTKNKSSLTLKSAELAFHFPQGFMEERDEKLIIAGPKTIVIGTLAPGEEHRLAFKAVAFGLEGEEKRARAILSYTPEKINVPFESSKDHALSISFVPVVLTFAFPSELTIGKEFEIRLGYTSTSSIPFPDTRLIFEPPDGFTVLGSVPPPTLENFIWGIGDLTRKTSGEILIRGVLTGSGVEKKVFRAQLGRYDPEARDFILYQKGETEVLVGLPRFVIREEFSGVKRDVVEAGARLQGKIIYKNESDDILENVALHATFEGAAFDFSSVSAKEGILVSATHTITWSQDTKKELRLIEAGEEGEVDFSVSILDPILQESFKDKEFTVTVKGLAQMNNVTLSEAKTTFKVASRLQFIQSGFFSGSPFTSSGPIPPKVGAKTTYTVSWQLLNYYNDLTNVTVRAALPAYASWEGRMSPSNANLSFDIHTGEVIWLVGDLAASTGIHMPVRQVQFQVGVTPLTQHIGTSPELISEAIASGLDTFTNGTLENIASAIDTRLPDDPTIDIADAIVVP